MRADFATVSNKFYSCTQNLIRFNFYLQTCLITILYRISTAWRRKPRYPLICDACQSVGNGTREGSTPGESTVFLSNLPWLILHYLTMQIQRGFPITHPDWLHDFLVFSFFFYWSYPQMSRCLLRSTSGTWNTKVRSSVVLPVDNHKIPRAVTLDSWKKFQCAHCDSLLVRMDVDGCTCLRTFCYGLGHVYNDLCAAIWFSYMLFYLQIILEVESTTAGTLVMIGECGLNAFLKIFTVSCHYKGFRAYDTVGLRRHTGSWVACTTPDLVRVITTKFYLLSLKVAFLYLYFISSLLMTAT